MWSKGITINTFYMKWKLLLLTAVAVSASLLASAKIAPPGVGDESAKKADLVGGVYNNDTKKPVGSVTITATHLSSKKEKVVTRMSNQFLVNTSKKSIHSTATTAGLRGS